MVFGKRASAVVADGLNSSSRAADPPEQKIGKEVMLVEESIAVPVVKADDDRHVRTQRVEPDEVREQAEDTKTAPVRKEVVVLASKEVRQKPEQKPAVEGVMGKWDWSSSLFGSCSDQKNNIAEQAEATHGGIWGRMCGGWSTHQYQPAMGPQKNDTADDDSLLDGSSKMFGDLSSLPSVNGDVTIDGASLRSTDLGGGEGADTQTAAVDKKLNELVNPTDPTPPQTKPKTGSAAMQNRRQLLIKQLRNAISTYGRYDVRCANISAALGDLLNETEEYEQAIKLHRDAVMIYTVKLGDDHSTTLNAKISLATVLANAGDYDEAINTYYMVTAMRRTLKGEKDPTVADGLALMAHCLRQNGEYQHAIKELKRALKIYRETLGDSHEKVSKTVDDIASLYVTLGDFEKSSAILEEVVKLKAATLGMKSKAVAETLTSLAMTYECSEKFTEAMKTLKKAYKIYTEIGGYSSEEATATLNKIAMLYEATGDYHRASIAFLGVLRGRKIHLGEDHLQVGDTYFRLGHVLRETGQLEKSLKCMKEALPIFVGQGVEISDVEKIAEVMHEMGIIYKEKKHFNEASRIFKQELSVRRKIGQPEFPLTARTLNLLGVTEYELKNNGRALKYLVEALSIYQDKGEHGLDCAEVLFNTGLVFLAVRNKDRALEAFVEAARLLKEHGCNSNHPLLMRLNAEINKIKENSSSKRSKKAPQPDPGDVICP